MRARLAALALACAVLIAPTPAYHRSDWPLWSDADSDCQRTREEVLIRDSVLPVTFRGPRRCKVQTGLWYDPYTGRWFTDPRHLDVDHVIALAAAHKAGGHAWRREKRRAYANDLGPDHLVVTSRSANRSKGAKGPAEWMPPLESSWCWYTNAWARVADRWDLELQPDDQAAVEVECW